MRKLTQKIKNMKKTIEETQPDPKSPHYRVCLYQFCLKPFMITDRNSEYCCKEHYDADYNRYRRNKKDDISNNSSSDVIAAPIQEEVNVLKKNIEILSKLSIDSTDGSIYAIESLEGLGFDYRFNTYKFPLCNTDNSYCIMYGPYETFLTSPTEILIKYKTN